MLRASDLIGIPLIVSRQTTDYKVIDWILDVSNNRLIGLLLTRGGWNGGAKVLMWQDVRSISIAAVHADLRSPIIEMAQALRLKRLLEDMPRLSRYELQTRRGRVLGRIIDFFIDHHTGQVSGLAVLNKTSVEADVITLFVPIIGPLNIVDGVIVIPSELLSSTALDADDTDVSVAFNDEPEALIPEALIEETIGHRLQVDIRNHDDYIIAAEGQIVTDNILNVIREDSQEIELLEAVGFIH